MNSSGSSNPAQQAQQNPNAFVQPNGPKPAVNLPPWMPNGVGAGQTPAPGAMPSVGPGALHPQNLPAWRQWAQGFPGSGGGIGGQVEPPIPYRPSYPDSPGTNGGPRQYFY